MKEAQRMMLDTTMVNPFNQSQELTESNYVQLGMLALTWIMGIVASLVCLCMGEAPAGEESTIPSVAEKAMSQKMEGDIEEEKGLMEGNGDDDGKKEE